MLPRTKNEPSWLDTTSTSSGTTALSSRICPVTRSQVFLFPSVQKPVNLCPGGAQKRRRTPPLASRGGPSLRPFSASLTWTPPDAVIAAIRFPSGDQVRLSIVSAIRAVVCMVSGSPIQTLSSMRRARRRPSGLQPRISTRPGWFSVMPPSKVRSTRQVWVSQSLTRPSDAAMARRFPSGRNATLLPLSQ